jgi:hypothetical protein
MIKCHQCLSDQVSVWGSVWIDFYTDGQKQVDEQALEEFEPKFGDDMFCRACGYTWTYGQITEAESGHG